MATEFTYKLQANGSEAGHLLSSVILTSSPEAAARRLVFDQSNTSIACTERQDRDYFAGIGIPDIVSQSTSKVNMSSLEPAAMWRDKATLRRADGHQFVVYLDTVHVMDGPYVAVVIVSGCGCVGANLNPATELVPGEAQAVAAIGHRLHDKVGH